MNLLTSDLNTRNTYDDTDDLFDNLGFYFPDDAYAAGGTYFTTREGDNSYEWEAEQSMVLGV